MRRVLFRHHEIDLIAWDACVAAAREVVPYAHSWWLQATAGRWDALITVDDESGQYLAVWPLPVKRRLWGREVYQPPFTQQLGLVQRASWLELPRISPLDKASVTHLASRYRQFYTQLNDANHLPARPAEGVGQSVALVRQRYTYHLPLGVAYDVLRAGYTADYRRRLRLQETATSPLRVTSTTQAAPLLTLFRATKGRAAGLKARHYRILRRLVAELQARQLLEIVEVHEPATQELLAGALFVRYRTRLIYLFAAASEAGKKAGAPLLLLDHQIRRYAGTPQLILDFEGGMIPSIARFFANFGATPIPYAALSFTSPQPWYLSWMR
ncbi:GNAT family N-acetyltransferase [Hymenobacter taeanensis]|uniref:GNAT family N-acetyltransferase n=1 Tax=Hymenobacter taeanensis TaxID=2735321 RepID=A0A6M6BJH1_9BACT|nr:MULTISPECIES: GNAT family N-acetyltransferase [Hymenobacter]QJX47215.1 GNAT family N-acetyltransferase [Hymenobacter taeanensis]UOQ81133.1 GNAT family N-acetyltransferase [Hymenobacter sp. 5414T-23]